MYKSLISFIRTKQIDQLLMSDLSDWAQQNGLTSLDADYDVNISV